MTGTVKIFQGDPPFFELLPVLRHRSMVDDSSETQNLVGNEPPEIGSFRHHAPS